LKTFIEIWNYELFTFGDASIVMGQLVLSVLLLIGVLLAYRLVLRKYFPKVFAINEYTEDRKVELRNILKALGLFVFILALIIILKVDYVLYAEDAWQISILTIVNAFIFFQFMRLFNWLISSLLISGAHVSLEQGSDNFNSKQVQEERDNFYQVKVDSIQRTVRWIFYTIFLLYILSNLHLDYTLFERTIKGEAVSFGISRIVHAALIILIARLIIWVITEIVLRNIYSNRKIEQGSSFAINQLIKYLIYVLAIVFALDIFGINMNILLGGAAALLVGIGLGLQQTFNDLISGIIILFERSVSVGDVLDVDGTVGSIKKIGLRASTIETRDSVSIVVPNHLLVTEKVTNWNNTNNRVRFKIDVGVAYNSDTKLVKQILLESVKENPYISYPYPFVRFENFGDSSLDFTLYFYSKNLLIIEDIKSDIRMEINHLFRENNIEIPYPQRVVHSTGQ